MTRPLPAEAFLCFPPSFRNIHLFLFCSLPLLLLEICIWCGCCCVTTFRSLFSRHYRFQGLSSVISVVLHPHIKYTITIQIFRQGLGMKLSGRAHIYEVLSLVPGTKKKSLGIVEIQISLCSTASPFSAVITPYICWIWWFTNLGICSQPGFTGYISATA